MEAYSTLIWKIIGAVAVLYFASKILALLTNTPSANPIQTATTTATAKPNQVKQEVKPEAASKSNQIEKVITTTTNQGATPEKKKEVFYKDSKDRETALEKKKRELLENARGKMLNTLAEPHKNAPIMPSPSLNSTSAPVITSPVAFSPSISPILSSPKVHTSPGELDNPVPLEQQLLNSNLSKSSPSPFANRTPVVEEKKPVKLSQSQSPNRSRKEKPAEEGLCLETGEIKTIPSKITLDPDRETKRRLAMQAFPTKK
jgi:hypothetical protein